MPLAALEKTWQFSVNHAQTATGTVLTTDRTIWLGVKNTLISFGTLPWQVRYSCDGTTAGSVGDLVDRWSTIANLVIATADTGTARSWIVLRNTDGIEILLEARNSSTNNMKILRVVVSFSAHFTGGTTTSRPTATDEVVLTNSDVSSATAVGLGPTSATDRAFAWHILHSTDGLATMLIFCNGGNLGGFWYLGRASQPVTGWTNPQVAIISGDATSPPNMSAYTHLLDRTGADATNLKMVGRFPSGNNQIFATSLAFGTGSAGGCEPGGRRIAVANELSNEWELPQIGIGCDVSGSRGMSHGRLFDTRWISTTRASGDDLPGDGSRQRAVFGNLVVPWNGTVALAA